MLRTLPTIIRIVKLFFLLSVGLVLLFDNHPLCHRHPTVVQASSIRASGCVGGYASTGGIHLGVGTGFQNGTLSDYDTVVAVFHTNGDELSQSLDEDAMMMDIATGDDYEIIVTASETFPIRGILLRFDQGGEAIGDDDDDGNGFQVTPQDETVLQEAILCEPPVVGLCHTSPADKTLVLALFQAPIKEGTVALDVTVVYSAPDGVSQFAYSS